MRQDLISHSSPRANRSVSGTALKVPFGLKAGRMWAPKQVPPGKACGCVCAACQAPLAAKAANSHRRRPHFAHLGASDCRTGYETALHLKAKQLIADRLVLRLPAWDGEEGMPNPPFAFDIAGGRLDGRWVDFPSRVTTLSSASIEPFRGDYTPDVVGTDAEGELLIEIRVSHAVDDLKRRRIQSEGGQLIEIDLSKLTPDQASDEEALAHWVLEAPSNRVWLSCPAATEDWRASHRDLKEEFVARNRRIAEQCEAALQAEQRARAISAAGLAEKQAAIARFKEQQRVPYRQQLEDLPEMVSPARIESLLDEYWARDGEEANRLIGSISSDAVKHAVRTCGSNAWIYQTHPRLWQAASFHHFIQEAAQGTQFNQRDVARWVMQQFGKEAVLYDLFRAQYTFRDKARKAGRTKNRISHWAFTELENRQIPNFYKPINDFIERLIYIGCLSRVPDVLGEVRIR
jgi:hypothetical protein